MSKRLITPIVWAALLCSAAVPGAAKAIPHKEKVQTRGSQKCNHYFSTYEKQYHIPENLLKAISLTETGTWSKAENKKVVWPWTINVNGKGYYFPTKQAAVLAVKKLKNKGYESIDVGCMQINLKHHPEAFENVDKALDPKYNIEYAAKFLSKNYKNTHSWKTAVKHYHSKNLERSGKYQQVVYNNWKKADRGINLAESESRESSKAN